MDTVAPFFSMQLEILCIFPLPFSSHSECKSYRSMECSEVCDYLHMATVPIEKRAIWEIGWRWDMCLKFSPVEENGAP